MCTVRTLYVKKQSIKTFMKSKFSAAHQKSALYLEKQKSLKNSAKCALCSAKCALCGSVRSDLTAPFKRPRKKTLVLRISEKMVEKQRRCAQISPSGFLSIATCKKKSCLFVYKM